MNELVGQATGIGAGAIVVHRLLDNQLKKAAEGSTAPSGGVRLLPPAAPPIERWLVPRGYWTP